MLQGKCRPTQYIVGKVSRISRIFLKNQIVTWTFFLLSLAAALSAAAEDTVVAGPFSIVRGQEVQFNVYHEADTWCYLRMYFTYGTDDLFLDEEGAAVLRDVEIGPGDPSHARKLTLSSTLAFAEQNHFGSRLRMQAHVVPFEPRQTFSPPKPPNDCQVVRLSVEICSETTGETQAILWDHRDLRDDLQ